MGDRCKKIRENKNEQNKNGKTMSPNVYFIFLQIVDVVQNSNTAVSEADVTFFVFDSGAVANGTYVASVLNRLTTGQMTTYTTPYAVRLSLLSSRPSLY